MLAALLAVAALAIVGWYARGGRRAAGHRYRRTIGRAWVLLGGAALIGLLALGRIEAVGRFPADFDAVRGWTSAAGVDAGLLIGIVAGEVLLVAMLLVRRRSGKPMGVPIGGAGLVPRDRQELAWAALLAITAGVTEELFFRLFLPLAVTIATASAAAGLVVSVAAFAAVHRYQGWRGMLATGAVGVVLWGVYLASGALWLAMLVHAVIDLNALVVRPLVFGVGRFSSSP